MVAVEVVVAVGVGVAVCGLERGTSINLRTTQLSGASRASGDEVVYEFCPTCGAGGWHFSINCRPGPRLGLWNCVAGRHTGGGGRILDPENLPIYNLSQYTEILEISEKEIILPDTDEILPHSLAAKYLSKRYLTQDTARILGLRDWKSQFRIFIPFCGETGDVIYYTARDYLGTADRKYLNASSPKTLYIPDQSTGFQAYPDYDDVVILEGPVDAIAVFQCVHQFGLRWRPLALAGRSVPAPLESRLRRLIGGRRVLIWLDDDDSGRSATLDLAGHVEAHAAGVRVLDWHDSGKDAASMGPDEIARRLLSCGGTP